MGHTSGSTQTNPVSSQKEGDVSLHRLEAEELARDLETRGEQVNRRRTSVSSRTSSRYVNASSRTGDMMDRAERPGFAPTGRRIMRASYSQRSSSSPCRQNK
ncbi:uncharacterized protein V6R79_006071 [Siganus canaliculatus]